MFVNLISFVVAQAFYDRKEISLTSKQSKKINALMQIIDNINR